MHKLLVIFESCFKLAVDSVTIGENSSLDSVDAIKNKIYKQWNEIGNTQR